MLGLQPRQALRPLFVRHLRPWTPVAWVRLRWDYLAPVLMIFKESTPPSGRHLANHTCPAGWMRALGGSFAAGPSSTNLSLVVFGMHGSPSIPLDR